MALVHAKQGFTYDERGVPVVISPHDLFDEDDPIVRARPEAFTPVVANRGVEQMTAAPGELRSGVRRPR